MANAAPAAGLWGLIAGNTPNEIALDAARAETLVAGRTTRILFIPTTVR